MARVEGGEYFDEIVNSNQQSGIFGDAVGLAEYDSIRESVSPDGLIFEMGCRTCNAPARCLVSWKELFLIGSNDAGKSPIIPAGWQYSENNATLYPVKYACKKCRQANGTPSLLCPHYTPDEARNRVKDAISRGFLPMAQAQQWDAEVRAYRQQQGG